MLFSKNDKRRCVYVVWLFDDDKGIRLVLISTDSKVITTGDYHKIIPTCRSCKIMQLNLAQAQGNCMKTVINKGPPVGWANALSAQHLRKMLG